MLVIKLCKHPETLKYIQVLETELMKKVPIRFSALFIKFLADKML